jgi:TatD DNase family protein
MHCFSGDADLARRVVDLGFLVSIPGIVTFKNATRLQEVARTLPLDAMILETDGPFLAPVPFRGKRNEPAYLRHTAEKISELRQISLEELALATSANARDIFALPEESV